MVEGGTSGRSLTKPMAIICLPGVLAFYQPVPSDPFLSVLPAGSLCTQCRVPSERPCHPFLHLPRTPFPTGGFLPSAFLRPWLIWGSLTKRKHPQIIAAALSRQEVYTSDGLVRCLNPWRDEAGSEGRMTRTESRGQTVSSTGHVILFDPHHNQRGRD